MNHELALSPTTSSTSLNQIVLFAAATISPQQQMRAWALCLHSILPSQPHKSGYCLQFGDEESVFQKGEAAYLRSPSEYDADSHSGWFESKGHPHSALHELSKGSIMLCF